jgi:hypothetical protein
MINAKIEDLTDSALQQIAAKNSIPNASSLKRGELIDTIKQKYPYASDLVLVPKLYSWDPKGWRSPSVVVSYVALLIAMLTAVASWRSVIASLNKINTELIGYNNEIIKDSKQVYKENEAYEIIFSQCMLNENWLGISFEQILAKYREKYQSNDKLRPEIVELQPEDLHYVLFNLLRSQLIHRSPENKYFPTRSASSSQDCFGRPVSAELEQAILKVLNIESGKYVAEKLIKKISDETKRKEDELYAVAACMQSRGLILLDGKGALWSNLEWKKEELLGRNPSGQRLINVPILIPANETPRATQTPEPAKADGKK